MPELDTDVRYIRGIGEQRAKSLGKLGIHSLRDLVSYFPRDYEDRTAIRPISALLPDETACVKAMVASEPRLSHVRSGMDLVKLRVVDESGALDITYFNQSYIKSQLIAGETYVFCGRAGGDPVRKTMTNPLFEREDAAGVVTSRIVPVYRLTAGISQKLLMNAVESGLQACGDILPDVLPERVRAAHELAGAGFSYHNIHFPADFEALRLSRKRLIFEELFLLACAMGYLRGERGQTEGLRLEAPDPEEFFASLPFTPTGAQKRAVRAALEDMRSGYVMNRLVQGDVGSGKTMVAAACAWYVGKCGYQCAFMAPTEILAEQHFVTLRGFLEPLGMRVDRLTGSGTAKQKRECKARLNRGETDLVVGTHALLSGDVAFRSLALVVTDEQPRFGVEQRAALGEKGGRAHVMVMSATPIPRTLALLIYGDLDVSVIDELPPGRQKVDTYAVNGSLRKRIYDFMRRLAGEGRQVFVVCPMIEENGDLSAGLVSATEYAGRLRREVFPDLRIGCVHGRMKPKDKDAEMARFIAGETDILVSTTVIEVGVDVPNAALMVVENAERFGLSQLHQLRGRVGRGAHKSYCVLISDAVNEEARERLRALCRTSDGFAIAEEDLRIRGPGDFFGSRQHGLPETHIADLCADMDVLLCAREAAASLLTEDPQLAKQQNAALRDHIRRLFKDKADTFN
jgi:ATP-dependent DNA helicase RecG